MIEKLDSVIDALQTLRAEIMQCPKTEQGIRNVIDKYDMLFVGGKFNTIYSEELCHTLKRNFDIEIGLAELNKMVPDACKALHMECEPMQKVNEMSNPIPYIYKIVLFE